MDENKGEMSAILKYLHNVISAVKLYLENPAENAALRILEKNEILVNAVLQQEEFAAFSNCVSALLNILNDNIHSASDMSLNILQFFLALAESPIGIWRETLAGKFQLHVSIIRFICRSKNSARHLETSFKLLLQLLYSGKTFPEQFQHYISELIPFLLKLVRSDDSKLLYALEVLALVSRDDPVAQETLRSHINIGGFCDLLVSTVNERGGFASVQVLLMVTSLALREINDETWIANNGNGLVKTIFKMILSGNTEVQCSHINLFMWLLDNQNFVSFLREVQFVNFFEGILRNFLVAEAEPVFMAKLFDLLGIILRTPTMDQLLMSTFLKMDHQLTSSINVALDWMARDVTAAGRASIQATHFLKDLLKHALEDDNHVKNTGPIFTAVNEAFKITLEPGNYFLDLKMEKNVAVLQLLNSPYLIGAYVKSERQKPSVELVVRNSSALMKEFCFKSSRSLEESDTCNYWKLKVRIIIETLQVLLHLKGQLGVEQKTAKELLTNPRVEQILSLAASSACERDVCLALRLMTQGSGFLSFSLDCLAKRVSKRNVELVSQTTRQVNLKLDFKAKELDKNDLKVEELKPSQVIRLYEEKIGALEANMENMTRALQNQAKLIAQMESARWSNFNEESLQLRRMLLKSEEKCESGEQELAATVAKHQCLQSRMNLLTEDFRQLKQFSDQQREAIEHYKRKIEDKIKENTGLKNETHKVKDANKTLTDHLSEARRQIDKVNVEKESVVSNMMKNLEMARNEIKELAENVEKLTKELEERESQIATQQNECAALRSELSNLKETLGELRKKLEATEVDLQKHKKLTEFIQNAAQRVNEF